MFRPAVRERRSLFGEILDWMLAPLLLLWPMSLGLTWLVAQSIANQPYDRELSEAVLALANQPAALLSEGAHPAVHRRREFERAAAQLLRRGDEEDDKTYFQVLGARGELVAGDPRLVVPEEGTHQDRVVRFRDDSLGDEPVRVAYLWLASAQGDDSALVQVAETLGRRSRLATEIIKGVLLPQYAILPLAVLLVWLALARGIRPLDDLQQRIRKRASTDLSPIPTADVPDEVVPLVTAINDLLQRLDRSIATQKHFLADAAHQLKTPLAGLRMQAELAGRELGSGPPDVQSMKHSLRQIALSSQRAAHMVNQLLSMARAEDTGQPVRPVAVDLAQLTRSVVRDFVATALEQRIDLGYEGPESLAPGLQGEPVLLGELVRNLVDNALQYTPAGGTVTVRVLPDPFGQVLVLQVEDTGPGIPLAERDAVFRPFYRVLDTQQVDGSGLGLAIVREIALRHGAEVSVDDALPRSAATMQAPGALFTVRFKLGLGAPSTAAMPGPAG